MKNILFEGIFSATFSIYDEQLNVKKKSMEQLVKFNQKNGVNGFYVGGNTGECTVLPNRTRKQVLEAVKENANQETQIIAHVGAGHLDDVVDLIQHANEVGVDAIASLPPSLTSFYKPDEIVEYYRYIASISKSPVLAYVTPVLNCDTIWYANEIMKIDNMIGIKLSIANYYNFERVKLVNNGDINILNGPDESMLSGLIMGADGAIGTTYNILPATSCKIYDNFMQGNWQEALKYQHKLNDCINTLFKAPLTSWKPVLQAVDIDPGHLVAPRRMPTKEELNQTIQALTELGCFTEEQI